MGIMALFQKERPVPGVFRVIGTDESGETMELIRRVIADPDTVYVPDGLKNPLPDELDAIAAVTNRMPPADAAAARKHIQRYMPGLGNDSLPNGIYDAVEKVRAKSPGTAYTAYAKILYWMKNDLAPAFRPDAKKPLIFLAGPVSKHVISALEAAAAAGVPSWYFDPVSDDTYRKADPAGTRSFPVEGPVRVPVDLPAAKPAPAMTRDASWQAGRQPWENMLVPQAARPANAAAVLAYVAGTGSRAEYRNMLYGLMTDLTDSGRDPVLIQTPQLPPDNAEIGRFRIEFRASYKGPAAIAELVSARASDPKLRAALAEALPKIPAPDLRKAYNRIIRTACWTERIASAKPGCVIGYGPFEPKETEAFLALACMGLDVIWFDPEATCPNPGELKAEGWTVPDAMTPGPKDPFPTAPERVRAETVAHAASREIDRVLYQGSGFYRDRQFRRSGSVTLRTTYDEVLQLWPEPPAVRPGFKAEDGTATVPCLFSKIAGVPDADERTYWNTIRKMTGRDVLLIDRLPFLRNPTSVPPAPPEGCSPEEFDGFANRPYDYLPDATRNLVLNAASVLCGPSTTLLDCSAETRAIVLEAARIMPKKILDLVQAFDPAKRITKVLVVQTGTQVLSRYECVTLALLNLVGLDVAIFTPAGYRDVEKWFRADAFDLIQAGPYLPDIRVPQLRKKSWLSSLLD